MKHLFHIFYSSFVRGIHKPCGLGKGEGGSAKCPYYYINLIKVEGAKNVQKAVHMVYR